MRYVCSIWIKNYFRYFDSYFCLFCLQTYQNNTGSEFKRTLNASTDRQDVMNGKH